MKCSNCGKEVPERAIVCGYCGEEQAQPAAKAPEPAPEKVVPVEKVDVAPKPAPKKAGPTEKAVSAQPSELPGWVIPAGLGAVALILVVVMLSGRSPQPGAVSSEAVQKELVYVHWDCEEEYVSAEDEIALYYNWTVLEEEQIGDYFSVVEHHVTINGDPVSILADGYGEIEQDGEGGCIYLCKGKCSIHKMRPEACREFFCMSKDKKFKEMIININIEKNKK